MKLLLALLLCLPLAAQGEAKEYPWLRRASSIGYCAASAFDIYSTKFAVDRGAIEANPLLKGPQMWTKMNVVKGVMCGASLVTGELKIIPDKWFIAINAGAAGVYVAVGIHNIRLGRRLKAWPDDAASAYQ